MKVSELRKIIRESIYEKLQQYPKDKPMLERDDVGSFFAVFKPSGGESLEELMFETNVLEYGTKIGERQIAALVKSENRARRIATNLRQGKINELAGLKQQEISEKMKQIKETQALMGALNQYFKLKEADPGNNKKLKEYDDTLKLQETELAALQKQKRDIEEGKIPKVGQPSSINNAPVTNNEEDIVDVELKEGKKKPIKKEGKMPKIGQPSSPHSKANLTNNEEDVVNPGLKEIRFFKKKEEKIKKKKKAQ